MHRYSGAGTSSGHATNSITATRRTTSLAEVLEAARESKLIVPSPEEEREALGALATAERHRQQRYPAATSGKCETGCAAAAAAGAPVAPRSNGNSLASILVLFTVSVVTAGFVACAVATGRYIASGGVYAGLRGRNRDLSAGPSMDLQVPAANPVHAVPPATAEEEEAEKLARRLMIQPEAEEASPNGGPEAGPATEPFRDIAAAAEGRTPAPATGRKRAMRTNRQPAREPKIQNWNPPLAVNNNTETPEPPTATNSSATSDPKWNLTLH
ncbi:uncharacterized protein LOC142570356 [Dermacentor variabilis]|uniref:uncharacterized protein LOC142570356 n=1 Tax=Dermacentor variabilis TaxID=34621 RepID=UPI003F5C57B4